jgi:Na+/phosphate symporter
MRSAPNNLIFTIINGIIVCLVSVFVFERISKLQKEQVLETIKKNYLYSVTTCLFIIFCLMSNAFDANKAAIYFQIITNLLLFLLGIRVLTEGLKTMHGASFYAGISIILTQVFLRYVDLIGHYIGGAALFFIAGLIMIAAAKYWKNHEAQPVNGEAKI